MALFQAARLLVLMPGSSSGCRCRQADEGGRTLEAEILQRRSTLTSSWGVMTDTSDPVTMPRASHASQVPHEHIMPS